jgi:hypothetical protein
MGYILSSAEIRFAIVSGNTSTLETAIFSLAALDEAILTFDQAYSLTPGAVISRNFYQWRASYSSEPILFQQSGSVVAETMIVLAKELLVQTNGN